MKLKEIEIEKWVIIDFYKVVNLPDGSANYNDKIHLFRYDIPRVVYERRKWVIDWRHAKYKCETPKNIIQISHSYYDKKTGLNLEYNSILTKYFSAKANVTRIENKMALAKDHYTPTLFKPSIEDTEQWEKALLKLNNYKTEAFLLLKEIEFQKNK